ncbi:hypothetical protein EBZ39_06850 [bacterium]|nr:hypothetical protein [bacterium]
MIRLQAGDAHAITVLVAATFAFKADELDPFIDGTHAEHVTTWNRYIDHAHMFIDHLSNAGFVRKVTLK